MYRGAPTSRSSRLCPARGQGQGPQVWGLGAPSGVPGTGQHPWVFPWRRRGRLSLLSPVPIDIGHCHRVPEVRSHLERLRVRGWHRGLPGAQWAGRPGEQGGCWGAMGWGQECCEAPGVLGVAQDRGTCSLRMPRSLRRVSLAVKISTCPGQCQTPGPAQDDTWWCPLVSPGTGTGHFAVLTSPLVLLLLGTPTTYSVRDESPECPHWDIEGGMGIPLALGWAQG